MEYDIIGIGNALVDIQVQVPETVIEMIGLPKGGMTLTDHYHQLTILNKLSGLPLNVCSGGSAANTIHGIGTFGGKTFYVGQVGNDEYGHLYAKDMAQCQVGFVKPDPKLSGTGTSIVLITPDAQRTMATHLGVSTHLNPNMLDEDLIKNCRYVYIEGYLFSGPNTQQTAFLAAKMAQKYGIPIAFTLSDTFIVNNFRDLVRSFITEFSPIIFCNENEGLALADCSDPAQAFDQILSMAASLFFTRGHLGAWVAQRNAKKESVPAMSVNAIDTTGAGDLFAAGALLGLLKRKSIRDCALLASYCASQVISILGARLPEQKEKDIDLLLSRLEKEINKVNP